jgi:hypothetical protein
VNSPIIVVSLIVGKLRVVLMFCVPLVKKDTGLTQMDNVPPVNSVIVENLFLHLVRVIPTLLVHHVLLVAFTK